MIFGNYPATVDPKGRLKIPTAVRSYFEETYGPDFFVTSIDGGQSVRVYPLSVWKEIAEKLASPPSFNKAKRKLADQTAYLGQTTRVDTQGRILIPAKLGTRRRCEAKSLCWRKLTGSTCGTTSACTSRSMPRRSRMRTWRT